MKILLENEEFLKLIDGAVYKEKAIRYKKNLRYIDLLVKHNDGRWKVIDYKSSTAFADHHQSQVSYYIQAIKEITGDEVDGYVCYLLKDKIQIINV